ncbi:MAG: biotin-independent malonate decarboxylase subunit beta [Defluviitaleaceae bacterium]|nr:biotin-independent malonate decarboxylase subunit beta [Defluviitaleaceae bacterium]
MTGWNDMQTRSFYESNARERARYLLDAGSFRELAGPEAQLSSPHLPVLDEAISFDDGVVAGLGKINGRPVFILSQEGRFIGGSVGEVGGAKMVGVFELALKMHEKAQVKYPNDESRWPAIVISFETGGVRLHEANAGLLAHAEVMELIQACRGKIPVLSLVGSKLGCFGGMGFVSVATDLTIVSELGRIGLTGPEVIEEVLGKREFDSADRGLIYRTTGGKHRYLMGSAAYLVEDSIAAFRDKVAAVLAEPYAKIAAKRAIGTPTLVEEQLELTALAAQLKPKDAYDIWAHFGNEKIAKSIPDLSTKEFLQQVKIRKGGGVS